MSNKLSKIVKALFGENKKEETVQTPVVDPEEERRQRRKEILRKERKIERTAAANRRELIDSPDISPESLMGEAFLNGETAVTDDTTEDEKLLKALRDEIGEKYIPDTHITKGEFSFFKKRFIGHHRIEKTNTKLVSMYIDWLFFCKDLGYDMDDYFDYEFYGKSSRERLSFVSAAFRENMRRHLNPEPQILMRKADFLHYFEPYINRDWLDCSTCDENEFRAFIERQSSFFCKAEKGFGAEGLSKLSPSSEELPSLFEKCKNSKSLLEEPIVQHEALSIFNPDTVNSIRVVTIADANDQIIIPSAAMRFGRKGCFADNYHQGGLCVKVDPVEGRIKGDAIDRTGDHYQAHPDSGVQFDGAVIPFWDKICDEVKKAALSCIEKDRFIGWDVTLNEDEEVDFIEANSRAGFAILQTPDMTGLKAEYVEILSGLVSEEALMDTRKGYWRKWKLDF